jgi:hypothetical protein
VKCRIGQFVVLFELAVSILQSSPLIFPWMLTTSKFSGISSVHYPHQLQNLKLSPSNSKPPKALQLSVTIQPKTNINLFSFNIVFHRSVSPNKNLFLRQIFSKLFPCSLSHVCSQQNNFYCLTSIDLTQKILFQDRSHYNE